MSDDKPKYYIEHFTENSEKVKNQTLEKYFNDIDYLSSFFHNLITCIDIKWNDEKNTKLNPYFEQIVEDNFLEIAKECENFICLLINGFYDGAIKSLRHILENFMIHYYFSVLERNGNLKKYVVNKAEFYKLIEHLTEDEKEFLRKYKEEKRFSSEDLKKIFKGKSDGSPIYEADSFFCWKQGKKYLRGYDYLNNKADLAYFPNFEKDCLNLIFKQDIFKEKEIQKLNLKKEINDLYKEFSKILHNRGTISRYKTASSFLNNSFNEEDLKKSIELYKKIEEIIAILLILSFFPNYNRVSFTYLSKYKKIKDFLESHESRSK